MAQRQAIEDWRGAQETITVEVVREEIEARYGIVYQSKQSYYDLLEQGGMSYHRSAPMNPKHNTDKVLEKREEIKKNFWHIKKKLLREK